MQNEAYIESLLFPPFKRGNKLRIIIAGGGTGGHIFPAIAIARALQKQDPNIELLFVGAKGKMEMEKVPEAGFKIIGLYIAGYNRNSIIKNITLPFKLAKSFYQVRKILKEFVPDAIIGVGGYSSFPMLRLAQTKNIPTFIHESNSYAGKSNKLLAGKAKRIFVASYGMEKFFPKEKILLTGNPVRTSISENVNRSEALSKFGLKPAFKTVLVIGGSLGAQSINQVIDKNILFFREKNLQLIWQTGSGYSTRAAAIEEESVNMWTGAFINDMSSAYAASDIIISRSGAMAVAELCIVSKPVIFIPYPHAAEDHQTANANALVLNHAALLVKDSEVDSLLIKTLEQLLKDDSLAASLSEKISRFAHHGADELIASEVLKSIHA